MNNTLKITIIIPFFGKLPSISTLFFFSCTYNKIFRILYFSDQKKPIELPANVEYIYFTLQDFNLLASAKLGLKINILYPYKLCDLKPMYGIIFKEYIGDSNFWGYCDLDMIFGNSNEFLTHDLLNTYDVITARKDSLAGNFTLYKNVESINNLFLKSDCWRQIIQNPWFVFSFPERFKSKGKVVSRSVFYRVMKNFHIPNHSDIRIPDMNVILNSLPEIKVYYGNFMISDMILKNRDIIRWEMNWENGTLKERNSAKSYLYFHFYFLKKKQSYFNYKSIDYQLIKSFTITEKFVKINY
jgi:hypothetical protein